MKILICGANGFIGQHLVDHFHAKGHQVVGTYHQNEDNIFKHKDVEYKIANLTQALDVAKVVEGMDIVIQAAAYTTGSKDAINKPYLFVTNNVVMNSWILQAAHLFKVKHLIFLSCSTMYESSDKLIKEIDFDANKDTDNIYFGPALTKVYIEKMCKFYSRIGSTRFTALRHSNIYGPGDKFSSKRSHVLAASIMKVLSSKGIVTVWGTGIAERDLLYISDLINFIDTVINKKGNPFELYNVGSGSRISIAELVKKIIYLSDEDLGVEWDIDKPDIPTKIGLDITKARLTGWEPQISLDDGITETLKWYREKVRKK